MAACGDAPRTAPQVVPVVASHRINRVGAMGLHAGCTSSSTGVGGQGLLPWETPVAMTAAPLHVPSCSRYGQGSCT